MGFASKSPSGALASVAQWSGRPAHRRVRGFRFNPRPRGGECGRQPLHACPSAKFLFHSQKINKTHPRARTKKVERKQLKGSAGSSPALDMGLGVRGCGVGRGTGRSRAARRLGSQDTGPQGQGRRRETAPQPAPLQRGDVAPANAGTHAPRGFATAATRETAKDARDNRRRRTASWDL